MANLHLTIINDSASYELRKSLARKAIAGQIDYYSCLRDEVAKPAAQKERDNGSKCSAAELKAQTLLVMRHDKEECMQAIRDAYIVNPEITARGHEWFDSVDGNSYHSVIMCVAGFSVYIPMQYGYGEQWKQTAYDWLVSHDIFKAPKVHPNGYRERDYSKINFVNIVLGKKSEL